MASIFWVTVPNKEYEYKLQWKTDVLKGYSGEQRVQLRKNPRQYFSFKYEMTYDEYRSTALAIANNPAQQVVMADWTQFDAGLFGLPDAIYRTIRNFRKDQAIVVHPAIPGDFAPFLADIQSVEYDPTYGKFLRVPNNDAMRRQKACLVAPQWNGRISSGIQFDLSHNEFVNASCEWIGDDPPPIWPLGLHYQTIGPDPVLQNYHTSDDGAQHSYMREVDSLDNEIASPYFRPRYSFKQSRYSFTIRVKVGLELEKLLGFVHYLRGRLKPFWLPLWGKNIKVIADIKANTNTIKCERIYWGDRFANNRICIWVKDGCGYKYKFIEAASVSDTADGKSNLTTTTTIATDTALSDIIMTAFMEYVRLDSDEVTVKFDGNGNASINFVAISIPIQA